ncbi:hypothetical protein LDO32_11020 [Luteimonas sp. Y-2-2-4F]|nr:RNase A-like domain-containing protein [Luteimonas sp. Y-2-2-4F]MCD9032255.1 hypothetical protein [Luteimonas sp. Y-2-2-4F]
MPEIAASPLPALPRTELPGQGLRALDAAAGDLDLEAHLAGLAESGGLAEFLSQTDEALDLAAQSPVFAQQLDPLLGRIRDGLESLPADRLDAAERERVDQTLSRLEAHLPEPPTGAPAAEVPGGGLEAHEDVGGHLIERHVGKSEQWLADRVANENISAASSFRDLPAAEHFVAETLAQHQDRIDDWIGGQGGNRLVVDARFDASTGISVQRGDTRAEDVFSVRLVLERSDALDIGYRIVTGYPTPP